MPSPGSLVALALFAGLVACGCRHPLTPLGLAPSPEPAASWGLVMFPALSFDQIDDSKDRDDLRALVAATGELAHSPQFQQALQTLPSLDTGRPPPEGQKEPLCTDARRAAEAFFGLGSEQGARRLPVAYTLVGNAWFSGETASTAIGEQQATTRVHEVVLSRYRTGKPEAVACALNTMIHEWTHAIAQDTDTFVYQDKNHGRGAMPLVSYTFGSVAQCVYLQTHGHESLRLDVCVAAVGTRGFNQNSCSEKWVKQLEEPPNSDLATQQTPASAPCATGQPAPPAAPNQE